MTYDFDDNTPIYLQLIEIFSKAIATGVIQPGEKMDTVRDLAVSYGVNPNTMQRALAAMEADGLLYSERTKGRFVTEDREKIRALREILAKEVLKSFIHQMKELDFTPEDAILQIEKNWREEE